MIDYFVADTLAGLVKIEGTDAKTNVCLTNLPGPLSKESAQTLYWTSSVPVNPVSSNSKTSIPTDPRRVQLVSGSLILFHYIS